MLYENKTNFNQLCIGFVDPNLNIVDPVILEFSIRKNSLIDDNIISLNDVW